MGQLWLDLPTRSVSSPLYFKTLYIYNGGIDYG